MGKKSAKQSSFGRHIVIRILSIAICFLAIISLIIFLYTLNHQNISQFWTELISYGLSILTPFLCFLLGDSCAKDKAEINFADRIDQIFSKIEDFEKNSRGLPNRFSSHRSDISSENSSNPYKPDIRLTDDKLNFLLDTGVINRRQYEYLLKKHLKQ
jgi:hypothetical protein